MRKHEILEGKVKHLKNQIKRRWREMKTLEIATELLNNSSNVHIKEFIKKYTSKIEELEQDECKDNSLIRFHNCIIHLKKENFDVKGWMLYEIPVFYSHVFMNKQTNKMFDLVVWNIGEVVPRYLDERQNEQDALTIREAMKKYVRE